ncbi:MAG: WYL domain-containing protein [Micropruina glycogenica]
MDPYGLVENAGRWYLLAGRDGDQRTYRVSRIVSAEVLDEAVQIPGVRPRRSVAGRRDGVRTVQRDLHDHGGPRPAIVDVFSTHARFQLAAGTDVAEGKHEAGRC